MLEEFKSQIQYLIGEYSYKFLCSTDQRYSTPLFQKILELRILLNYLLETVTPELYTRSGQYPFITRPYKESSNEAFYYLTQELATQTEEFRNEAEQFSIDAENSANEIEDLLNDVENGLASKEDYVTPGLITQYYRGDKTWQTLNTSVVPELVNLYFTEQRVRLSVSLTTIGNSGVATYNNTTGVFNIPNYTLVGLGGEPAFTKGAIIQGTGLTLTGTLTNRLVESGDITIAFDEAYGDARYAPISSVHPALTLGLNQNGLSLNTGLQSLQLGLASAGVTGALSGADWSTFNGKIGGTIANGQVAFGTGANTIGGDDSLLWDSTNKNLSIVNGRLFISRGTSNVFIGDSSTGSSITTGNSNVGFGFSSVQKTTTGLSNLGIGTNALRENETTSNNTALGANTLLNIASGGSNIGIGTNAGRFIADLATSLTSSTSSIFIGINSRPLSNASNNQIVIGASSVGLGDNTIVLGNSSHTLTRLFGSVGIGVDATTNTLDVNGTTRVRTIANAVGEFVTVSATGVIQKRTPSEVLSDIGGVGGSLTSGRIPFATGSNTISDDSGLTWNNTLKRLSFTSTTNQAFFIAATTSTISSGQGAINILSTEAAAADLGGTISFRANTTTLSNYPMAVIAGKHETLASGNFSGYLQFITSTAAGNTTEKMRITSAGQLWIGTTSGTNTLDVNGTARIRSISNLGIPATRFSVFDVTGVLSERTGSELRSDIGAQATISGTLTDGFVATIVAGIPTWSAPSGGGAGLTQVTATNTDFTASVNTTYYLPEATLSTNRTITIPAGTNGDPLEFVNLETGFSWLLAGAPVYLSDGVTTVTQLLAHTNYILRKVGGSWRVMN